MAINNGEGNDLSKGIETILMPQQSNGTGQKVGLYVLYTTVELQHTYPGKWDFLPYKCILYENVQ